MDGEASEGSSHPFHRGIGGGMRAQGDRGNTGSPMGWPGVSGQPETREGQTGPLGGGGWARRTDEAGVMLAEERGPCSRQTQEVAKDQEIDDESGTSG
jgi:hypothetical protein